MSRICQLSRAGRPGHATGTCGEVALDGVKCAALVKWPKAIHEGNGDCVFIVDPATTDAQIGVLAQIFGGTLGGLPWELLGPTFKDVGLEKAAITITGEGVKSTFAIAGLGEGRGEAFKNLVTGEDHHAVVDLPEGFIWTRGHCGQGTFDVKTGPLSLAYAKTNRCLRPRAACAAPPAISRPRRGAESEAPPLGLGHHGLLPAGRPVGGGEEILSVAPAVHQR